MNDLIRVNIPCGTDTNVSAGREPCQLGWYEWIGRKFCHNKNVMDVGAGMCLGIDIIKNMGASSVFGQDIDNRLSEVHKNIIITDIQNIEENSYDVVTCFDVIEHVMEDLEFFHELKRITKDILVITTPNFTRSQARNHFHCREYTIPQFVNSFFPNEVWVASPDGKIHHTLLLKKIKDNYLDITRNDVIYEETIPNDVSFCHSTVDGNEWPHMCGVFYVK